MSNATVKRPIWMHVLPEHRSPYPWFESDTTILIIITINYIAPSCIIWPLQLWEVGTPACAFSNEVNHVSRHSVSVSHEGIPIVVEIVKAVDTVPLCLHFLHVCAVSTPSLEGEGALFDSKNNLISGEEGKL